MRYRALAGGFTLLVAGAPAVAVAISVERDQVRVPAGEHRSATAKCSAPERAVAGGFANPNFTQPSGEGPHLRPVRSHQIGPSRWTARGLNAGNPAAGPARLIAFAYCREQPGIRGSIEATDIGAGSRGQVKTRCPAGTRPLSGGFSTDDFPNGAEHYVITSMSQRAGRRGWKAGGANVGLSEPGRLVVRVSCAKGRSLAVRSRSKPVAPNGTRTVRARCARGQIAVSGGFKGVATPSAARGLVMDVVAAYGSWRPRGRVWQVDAVNLSGSIPGRMTAFAYCQRRG